MAEPRFFIDTALAPAQIVDLPKDVVHHASHVLRLRDGDAVVLFNGRGGEFHGRLAARGKQVDVERHDPIERESPLAVTLVQAWIATDKLDWVVTKAVELGVTRIVLVPARRSVVQLDGQRRAKRVERLRDTVIAACCQCGRNRVPGLEAFEDLPAGLAGAAESAVIAVVLQPDALQSLVGIARPGSTAFALATGPEGGFDTSELAHAARAGYRPASLGPRILRTETAGLSALSILQAIAGDLR